MTLSGSSSCVCVMAALHPQVYRTPPALASRSRFIHAPGTMVGVEAHRCTGEGHDVTGDGSPLVILLDVDNTLLDNDAVKTDLDRELAVILGEPLRTRFWQLYEDVRRDLDVVSFPVTL